MFHNKETCDKHLSFVLVGEHNPSLPATVAFFNYFKEFVVPVAGSSQHNHPAPLVASILNQLITKLLNFKNFLQYNVHKVLSADLLSTAANK